MIASNTTGNKFYHGLDRCKNLLHIRKPIKKDSMVMSDQPSKKNVAKNLGVIDPSSVSLAGALLLNSSSSACKASL